MKIKIDGRVFELDAKVCSELGKIRGLMFRKRKNAKALIFNFSKPTELSIHSFFVFFPFFAVWLDDKNKIVSIKKVNPFNPKISSEKPFSRLVEIPATEKYAMISNMLSAKEKARRQKV